MILYKLYRDKWIIFVNRLWWWKVGTMDGQNWSILAIIVYSFKRIMDINIFLNCVILNSNWIHVSVKHMMWSVFCSGYLWDMRFEVFQLLQMCGSAYTVCLVFCVCIGDARHTQGGRSWWVKYGLAFPPSLPTHIELDCFICGCP